MMSTKDGGPAFPVHHSIDGNWQREPLPEFCGMSLRDWFAGQALALLGSRSWDHAGSDQVLIDLWAASSYAIADAMLKARESSND